MEYEIDRDYLERRYWQSLKQALQARDPSIAKTHLEFAGKYAGALERDYGLVVDAGIHTAERQSQRFADHRALSAG
jgi:hypothetical protein